VAWYDFRNSPANMLVTTGHSGDTGISDVYYTSSSDHGSGSPLGRPNTSPK